MAYIVGRDEKYTSIEKAVTVANGLDSTATTSYIVSVYVDSNKDVVTISNSFTINSNVTLLIPFVDAADNKTTPTRSTKTPDKDNEYAQVTTLDKATLKKTVVVNSNVTITNNGTIEIAGELSGGSGGQNYAGQTAGRYSEIIMSPNSKIQNNKTIECYGYINEGTYNAATKTITRKYAETNGGKIVNSGAYFGMPFVLRDYRGGSAMKAIYDKMDDLRISAFNQIELMNVNCEISFDASSKLVAYANLYTSKKDIIGSIGIPAQMNSTDIRFIGAKNGDEFYLIEPSNDNFLLVAHRDMTSQINNVQIYGGAKTNSMSLNVTIVGMPINVSTEKVFFPLSFRHRISLLAGNKVSNPSFTMDQRFKIMPGSSFYVGKGATLNVNELAVYKRSDFDDTGSKVGGQKYPTKYPGDGSLIGDGRLIVDGTLNANSLSGYCEVTKADAVTNIKNSTSLTLYEAKTNDGTSLTESYTIPTKLSLNHLDRYHGTTFSEETDLATGTYTSIQRSEDYGFITDGTLYEIKYHVINAISGFDENKVIPQSTGVSRKTSEKINYPTYQNNEYVCKGVYFDGEKSKEVTVLDSSSLNYLDSEKYINLFVEWTLRTSNMAVYSFENINGNHELINSSIKIGDDGSFTVANPENCGSYNVDVLETSRIHHELKSWKIVDPTGQYDD